MFTWNGGCKSFARMCEKTAHPVTTTDRRSALCLKFPMKSGLLTSTHDNSKTTEPGADPGFVEGGGGRTESGAGAKPY